MNAIHTDKENVKVTQQMRHCRIIHAFFDYVPLLRNAS